MQLFVHSPSFPNKIYNITPTSNEYPTVTPMEWAEAYWSPIAVVYGGKHLSDQGPLSAVLAEITRNYKSSVGVRQVNITEQLVGMVSGYAMTDATVASC